jgi:CelD/BcsL family acetyltransferase involved in cellulose biosynthesis
MSDPVRLETIEGIGPVAAEWDALADRLRAGPFVRPGWIAAWSRAFAGGTPTLLVARTPVLTGLAPILSDDGAWRSPTNEHSPAFAFLAERRAVADALAASLFRTRPRGLAFGALEATSPTADGVRTAAAAAGYRLVVSDQGRSSWLAVEGDWERYEQRVGAKRPGEISRARRALAREGPVTCQVVADDDPALLAEGFRLQGSDGKAAPQAGILARPETHRFYTEIAAWTAARGSLRLFFLRVGGRTVAFRMGIEEQGVLYSLKGGYDRAYARFAPAHLVLEDFLRYAFASGLDRVELLGDAAPHAPDWTENTRQHIGLSAFPPDAAGTARWAAARAWRAARPAARRLYGRLRDGQRRGRATPG